MFVFLQLGVVFDQKQQAAYCSPAVSAPGRKLQLAVLCVGAAPQCEWGGGGGLEHDEDEGHKMYVGWLAACRTTTMTLGVSLFEAMHTFCIAMLYTLCLHRVAHVVQCCDVCEEIRCDDEGLPNV